MNTRVIPSRNFPDNFVNHLQALAQDRATDTALIVLNASGDEWIEKRLDYVTLDLRVKAFSAILQQRLKQGERALLLMENDEHYVVGFLACLYAGVIASASNRQGCSSAMHYYYERNFAVDW